MPFNQHPRADFEMAYRFVVKAAGISDPNYPEGDSVRAGAPFTERYVKEVLLRADVETILIICSVLDHPFRSAYFDDENQPDLLSDGDRLPAFLGEHGGLKIQITEGGETRDVQGRLAQSFAHLERAKKYPAIYGSIPELYWIENGRIHMGSEDSKAEIRVPTIPFEDASAENPELFSPAAYSSALEARALTKLFIKGTSADYANYFNNLSRYFEAQIIGKALSLPEPERMERLAT